MQETRGWWVSSPLWSLHLASLLRAALPGLPAWSLFPLLSLASYIRTHLQSFLLPEAFSDPGQKKSIFLLAVLRALDLAPLSYCDGIVTWPCSPPVPESWGPRATFCVPGTQAKAWHREMPGASTVHGAGPRRPMCLWFLRKP